MLNRRNLLWLIPLLLIISFPVWRLPVAAFLQPRGSYDPGSGEQNQDSHNFVMDKVIIMQNQAGKTTAEISADQALTSEKPNEFVLVAVYADLYGEDDELVKISARKGIYNTETRELTLIGDVHVNRVATRQQLFTELLYYFDHNRTIKSPGATRLLGEQVELNGSSLDYDIITGQYQIGGRVKGTIVGFGAP
jgi:LPS export ABC transporter protein LptC